MGTWPLCDKEARAPRREDEVEPDAVLDEVGFADFRQILQGEALSRSQVRLARGEAISIRPQLSLLSRFWIC